MLVCALARLVIDDPDLNLISASFLENLYFSISFSNNGKSEIISLIAERTGATKAETERVYNETFNVFKEELAKGNNIAVNGFGTFKVSERNARNCRNPKTGETINVPAHKAVSFKVGSELKKSVN